jgi:hypothetical protein
MAAPLTVTGKGKAFNFDATVLEMDERSFDSRSSGSAALQPDSDDDKEEV